MLKSLPLSLLNALLGAGLLVLGAPALAASPAAAPIPAEMAPLAQAAAASPDAQPGPSQETGARPPTRNPAPIAPALGRPATAAGLLADERGGAVTVSNQAQLSGVVSNNSATQVTTGANIIQSNSFANASGIPVVIQNSGANVLIQNATVINLQLK